MNLLDIFKLNENTDQFTKENNSILEKCNSIAKVEYDDYKNSIIWHNTVCPNPNCHSTNVVHKINHVYGETSNTFSFLGNIESKTNIDTKEVNHCNDCGNEWKVAEIKYISKYQVLKIALKYLAEISKDITEKEKEWKLRAISIFDGCSYETIVKLFKTNRKEIKIKPSYKFLLNEYK